MDLLWIIDPGHGWLRVEKQSVDYLGIEVSPFSYIDSYYYYLEEDCDAAAFLDRTQIGDTISIPEVTIDSFENYRSDNGIVGIS